MESQTQLRSNQAGDNRDFRQLSPAEMSLIKRTTKMLGPNDAFSPSLEAWAKCKPLEQQVRMDGQTMTLEDYIDGIDPNIMSNEDKKELKAQIREQGTSGGGLPQRQQTLDFN